MSQVNDPEEARAQHIRDAESMTLRIHIWVVGNGVPTVMGPDGALYMDGNAGSRLCGTEAQVDNEVNLCTDLAPGSYGRLMWEHFPNRCERCVELDALRTHN